MSFTFPPIVQDSRVHDLYLNAALFIQALLFFLVLALRLPKLRKVHAETRLLNSTKFIIRRSFATRALRLLHVACAAALAGLYIALLALDPADGHQDAVSASASVWTDDAGDAAAAAAATTMTTATAAAYDACRALAVVMWVGCGILAAVELRLGLNSALSLRLWWLLNLIVAGATFVTDLIKVVEGDATDAPTIVRLAGFAPSLFLGLAALFEPDTPSELEYASRPLLPAVDGAEPEQPLVRADEATASIWSRLTFGWISSLLAIGAKRSLEHSDLFELQARDSTKHNAELLTATWRREVAIGRNSFFAAFHRAFGAYFWKTGLLKLINDGCNFMNPVFINTIVSYIDGKLSLSPTVALLCALGMFLFNTTLSLALGQYFWRGYRLSLRVKVAVGQVVYKKALSLDHKQRQAFGTGAIVSYMQIDAAKLGDSIPYLHVLWSGPLQLVIALAMLYNLLGVSGFAGLGVMVVMMPLNIVIGRKTGKLTAATMAKRDKRVKFTNEVLQGIRILKLFAWEDPMMRELLNKREIELRQVRGNMLWSGLIMFLFTATPVFVTCATFVVYTALGNELTAAKAFTSLTLFNLLRFPIIVIPMMITRVIDLAVVSRRLSKFLSAPEREVIDLDAEEPKPPAPRGSSGGNRVAPESQPLAFEGQFFSRQVAASEAAAVELTGCEYKWPAVKIDSKGASASSQPGPGAAANGRGGGGGSSSGGGGSSGNGSGNGGGGGGDDVAGEDEAMMPSTLWDITLSAPRGAVVGVTGPVGCGKTTLLASILGDVPRVAGRAVIRGEIAYCAQEPWIQNISLRDNVLFGRPMNEPLYHKVLSACALEADLKALADGDMTEIGERGLNLSGGQKARVALARACYAQADTYLLDDVLSAVDAEVGQHLMTKCIAGLLREMGATVIFVTHHTHWLHLCDTAVFMGAGGTIEKQGPPDTLSIPRNASERSLASNKSSASLASAGALTATDTATATARNGSANGVLKHRVTPGTKAIADELKRAQPGKEKGKLTQAEERERGTVKMHVWMAYFRSLGVLTLIAMLSVYAFSQSLIMGSSWWLGRWAADSYHQGTWFYTGVYAGVSIVASLTIFVRLLVMVFASLRAARAVHDKAIHAVAAAPMAFFDTNPLGRILNRFSVDQQKVDVQLSPTASQLIMYTFNLIGTLVILTSNSPWIAISLVPLAILYVRVASYYRESSREMQRLDSISKSPIYTAFTEAVNGTPTIQAFRAADRFAEENSHKFDYNQRAGFVSFAANRWLTVRLEFLSNILLALTALLSVLTYLLTKDAAVADADADASADGGSHAAAAMAGLALSYAPGLSETLNWLLRQFTTLETMMVSIERLVQYADIPAEEQNPAAPVSSPTEWPSRGHINFIDVTMCYRPGLPNVLDAMQLEVQPCEKVGIVGRTGAGKSSVLVCLFRLVELKSGTIEIDGRDISKMPLREVRSRLSIIPQDPVLFTGTLRYNLDPFNEFDDGTLWRTLAQCSMDLPMRSHPAGLDRPIEERGANLSMGQRQLVCMCRALLKNSRVLVLDEATASVDMETDALIQKTLETELTQATVLTIAHRLDTIMGCDRVVVMAAGKVAETGPPLELREREGSRLKELWEARG